MRRPLLLALLALGDLKQDLGPELGDLGSELQQLRPREVAARLWDEDDATPHVR